MKKRILLALFLVLCLTFALCACGDDEDTEPSGKDSTTNTSSVDNSKTESEPEEDNGNGDTGNGDNGGEESKGYSQGLEFSLNSDGASYTVVSLGTCKDTDIVIPSEYEGKPVTSIGYCAFEDCNSLTSIKIPESVTSIENFVLAECTSLTTIEVAANNTAYMSIDGNLYTKDGKTLVQYALGKKDTQFVIPEGVTSMGIGSFACCFSLTSIVLPEGVTSIGERAFWHCDSLTSIEIPEGVTSIGMGAFSDCTSLTSVVIPKGVTSIGSYAFSYCTSLIIYCEAEEKPNGWQEYWNLGCPVVWNCNNNEVADNGYIYTVIDGIRYGLKDGAATVVRQPKNIAGAIVIPESITYKGVSYQVTSIVDEAFYECTSLTSIELPEGVTSIGEQAFYRCSSLTSIELPEGVTSIGEQAFERCSSLSSIVLPESVTSIGEYAFSSCDSLTSIVIPKSVTSIGSRAFEDCDSLTSIVIPKGVTSIGYYAFEYCPSLTIYCEVEEEPDGWDRSWKNSRCPVVWNCNNNDVADNGYIYTMVDGIRYGIKDGAAMVARQPRDIEGAIVIPESITYKGASYQVTSIVDEAFLDCPSLTSVEIPKGVTSIGRWAFQYCSSLPIYCEVEAKPDGWHEDWNNSGCPVVWNCNNNDVADNGYIYTVIDGIRYGIKDGAATVVEQPSNIEGAIVILGSITYKGASYQVTSIGVRAFYCCSSLTSIKIPESVTSIGEWAFYGCKALTSIVIPKGVTSIGYGAFEYCPSLTIYCEVEEKPNGWHEDWNLSGCPVEWGYKG